MCVGSATEWLSLCIDRSGFHTPDSPSPLRNRQPEPPGTLRTANVHNVSIQQVWSCIQLAVWNLKCIYNREINRNYHIKYFLYILYFITGTLRTANVHTVSVQQVWRCIQLAVWNLKCIYNREEIRISYKALFIHFVLYNIQGYAIITENGKCTQRQYTRTASLTLYTYTFSMLIHIMIYYKMYKTYFIWLFLLIFSLIDTLIYISYRKMYQR